MRTGRPSLYKPEYIEKMIKYFDVKLISDEGGLNDFPTLAGFAIEIGVHRDTLHEWANAKDEAGELKFPDFSDAYKRVKDYQERFLVNGGLRNILHPNFTIFTTKNVLGWRDKQPDEDGPPVQVNNITVTDEQLLKIVQVAKDGEKK